jgi:hypothetical protein
VACGVVDDPLAVGDSVHELAVEVGSAIRCHVGGGLEGLDQEAETFPPTVRSQIGEAGAIARPTDQFVHPRDRHETKH